MVGNLNIVSDDFSTISQAVFVMIAVAWHTQACPHLELAWGLYYKNIKVS
jgi:hypothetical protein